MTGASSLVCGPPMKGTMPTELTPLPGVGVQPSYRSSGRLRRLSDMASAGFLEVSSQLVSPGHHTILYSLNLHSC